MLPQSYAEMAAVWIYVPRYYVINQLLTDDFSTRASNDDFRYWPCAPKARITSGGRFHPDSWIGPVAGERLGRMTGWAGARDKRRLGRLSDSTGRGGWPIDADLRRPLFGPLTGVKQVPVTFSKRRD